LSRQAEISIHDASKFIDKYFETYPKFREYIDRTVAFAREYGYVETLLGRRRPIPEITSSAVFRREGAERVAINTPIQGTSADLIKLAMMNILRTFAEIRSEASLILQVHDELVFEVPLAELENIKTIVREKMENAIILDLPVIVDIGSGPSWGDAH
jgi:DNA polymerase-1